MDPEVLGLLGGTGLGLLKGIGDQERERKNMLTQAAVARYSPWTKMQADLSGPKASPIGSALQGAIAGGGFASANKNLLGGGSAGAVGETDPVAAGTNGAPMSPVSGVSSNDLSDFYAWKALKKSEGG